MKSINKILIATVVVASLATGAVIAHNKSERHDDHMVDHITERLDLDNAQKTNLATMLDELHDYRDNLRDRTKEQIRAAMMQTSLSPEDALKLIELRQQSRQQANSFMATKLAEFHATLNATQREQAADMILSMTSRHGRNHYGDGHRGRGKCGRDGHGWHHDDDDDDDDHHGHGKHRHGWYH